ncbi:MAG TPA: VanW family protein [Polyangiales bacterium]|nr:VanW family protein [Polyangiales bacterium]
MSVSTKPRPHAAHVAQARRSEGLRIGAVVLALVLMPPVLIWLLAVTTDGVLPGTRIGGVVIDGDRPLTPYLSVLAETWAAEHILVQLGQHQWRPTRAELGGSLSVEEAAAALLAVGHSANPWLALPAWWRAYLGDGQDVAWRARITNAAALEDYVQQIRAAVDRPPTPGSYDPEQRPIPGIVGEAVDVEQTRRAIGAAIARGDLALRVDTLVTPPPIFMKRFASERTAATVLMMRQETDYRPGTGRATNIELAAHKLDGALLMPGAALSFNQVVGKRDAARGFAPALELMNGEVSLGVGGGVCQVAGTLHAAAFFAGLQIEEYRPHSRLNQFAYLRPGLDTMVAWPDHVRDLSETKDMRIRNPYPFPVVIKTELMAKLPGQRVLRVELYGGGKPYRVDWSFSELERTPAGELRRPDRSLRVGEVRVQQESLEGLVILRRRTIYTPLRRIDEETRVAYPPTPRVLLVGSS